MGLGHALKGRRLTEGTVRRPRWCRQAARMLQVALLVTLLPHGTVEAAWRAPVHGERAVVASAHPLATRAGELALAAGGNAADAAVAMSFAIAVTEPWGSGLGGGAFVVSVINGKVETFDMREMAPASATRDMFVVDGKVEKGASISTGRASGVPGLVRGMVEFHKAHGSLPLAQVLAPAISFARDGMVVSEHMHRAIAGKADYLNDAGRRVFLRADGSAPKPGSILVQADLGKTLERIAATAGEDFYTGTTAKALVAAVNAEGGAWTMADLAGYVVKRRAPVMGTYRGYTVASMGPPSSGGLLLVQMLKVLERFDLHGLGFGSAAYSHKLAEAMKRAFAMRAKGLGDPDFVAVDRKRFIGDAATKAIGDAVAAAETSTPASAISEVTVKPKESTHTSHFGVLMANGDAVGCTQTINLRFGSGKIAAGTGVVLNNEMDDFSALPGSPNAFGLIGDEGNAVAAKKRPLSSMTPTIVLRDGKAVGVFGSPGGSRIITTTLQSILNVIDHKMNVSEALGAPRIHHQWYPEHLFYEHRGLSPDTITKLDALGQQPKELSGTMGNAMALWRVGPTRLSGAADPRGEGAAGAL